MESSGSCKLRYLNGAVQPEAPLKAGASSGAQPCPGGCCRRSLTLRAGSWVSLPTESTGVRAINSPPWDNSNMALLERQAPLEETLERSDESGHRGTGS